MGKQPSVEYNDLHSRPVSLELAVHAEPVFKLVQTIPRPLPIDPPPGCLRPPPCWPSPEQVRNNSVNEVYARVIGGIEQEVLGRHDVVGREACCYQGRGSPLKFCLRAVLPQRQSNTTPAAVETRCMKWTTAILSELDHVLASILRNGSAPGKRRHV
jgi:hypothetical protein